MVVAVDYDYDYVEADVCIQSTVYTKILRKSNRGNIDGSYIDNVLLTFLTYTANALRIAIISALASPNIVRRDITFISLNINRTPNTLTPSYPFLFIG